MGRNIPSEVPLDTCLQLLWPVQLILTCGAMQETCEMHEAFAKNISHIHIAFNTEG